VRLEWKEARTGLLLGTFGFGLKAEVLMVVVAQTHGPEAGPGRVG
jgi:hypothetical protein